MPYLRGALLAPAPAELFPTHPRLRTDWVLKPSPQPVGVPRKIVGFHRDPQSDWVAKLECGHQQHVRQNPPYTERHWVTTAEGRQAHLGHELQCPVCGATDERKRR